MFLDRFIAGNVRPPNSVSQRTGQGGPVEGPDSLVGPPVESPAIVSPEPARLPSSLVARHSGAAYRTPTDLCRSEVSIRRVLLIGACLSAEWMNYVKQDGLSFDYILTNNFSPLPEAPPSPIAAYDFQIVQIPLRSVLHENTYNHLAYADLAAYEALFANACAWLTQYLDIALAWNTAHWIQSFVTNFMVPQQSTLGRLLPRDDLRNMAHFVERLNGHLYRDIARRTNVYLLDTDQIAAGLGRHTLQDDGVWTLSHGALLNDSEHERDQARIVPMPAMSGHYPAIADGQRRFYEAAWAETVAMVRTLRQIDSVKLVVFDLDDTLWRGVVAEEDEITPEQIEGWPVGLMEAACFLKQRGVLLAAISRNDESRIVSAFNHITGNRLHIEDFAARRINWRLKTDNMAEILDEVHLTPKSVVFVDDNPVERAAMQARFPDIRCLGAHPYYLRRILLWSAETQVPVISPESARRTEMVQAQIMRDQQVSSMSREEFLGTLDLRMKIIEIRSIQDKRFARALELINKTNQFNTTGRRLTQAACTALFGSGSVFHAFELHDRFSDYGLVGVAIVQGGHISQFVMSCRVLGLGAEDALLAHVAMRAAASGQAQLSADYIQTNVNAPARDLYTRHGFAEHGGTFRAPTSSALSPPAHIHLEHAPAAP
jgi:FkbH-like protein